LAVFHKYCYVLNNVTTVFVVETVLSSQFAWVSVFNPSNLSLKHAYIKLPEIKHCTCVFQYVQIRAIIYSTSVYWNLPIW